MAFDPSFKFSIRLSLVTLAIGVSQLLAYGQKLSLSRDSLPGFREVWVHTVSDVQFYNISATKIESPLIISSQYPLKISLSCQEYFDTLITLVPFDGVIDQRIFVRAFPETTGTFTPEIAHQLDQDEPVRLRTSVSGINPSVPAGYYSGASASGSLLKTQLHHIITDHTVETYTSLWTHFVSTDITFNGFVWDIYSDIPCDDPPYLYRFEQDQDIGLGGTHENDVFNREHSMPRSWFGGAVNPMNTDLHHIYPVDKHVNARRDNFPYGTVSSPSWQSMNGGRLGPNVFGEEFRGISFEPIDGYKGDLARTFLYMITRYEDQIENWNFSPEGVQMLALNRYPGFHPWVIEMFLEWHQEDPVSQKERVRNEAIYQIQGNRNPFIDHPEFVERIWGDTTLVVNHWSFGHSVTIFPNPATKAFYFSSEKIFTTLQIFSISGALLKETALDSSGKRVDVSMLKPGSYILRFTNNKDVETMQLIIY